MSEQLNEAAFDGLNSGRMLRPEMKNFRVSLSVGGVVFVQADRFESDGTMIRFYRGDDLTAEYACASVKEEITTATPTERIGLFAPREEGEKLRRD